MAANAPEIQILKDNDKEAVIKILGYFTAATTSNTPFAANTLLGANTAATVKCISSITNMLYSTSSANGRVSVEFIGTANSRALTFGHFNDGEMQKYIVNNAVAPTGDYNINLENMGANDSFVLIMTIAKENMGLPGNTQNWGSGGWANAFTWQ